VSIAQKYSLPQRIGLGPSNSDYKKSTCSSRTPVWREQHIRKCVFYDLAWQTLTAACSRRTLTKEERAKILKKKNMDFRAYKYESISFFDWKDAPNLEGQIVQGSCSLIRLLDRVIIQTNPPLSLKKWKKYFAFAHKTPSPSKGLNDTWCGRAPVDVETYIKCLCFLIPWSTKLSNSSSQNQPWLSTPSNSQFETTENRKQFTVSQKSDTCNKQK